MVKLFVLLPLVIPQETFSLVVRLVDVLSITGILSIETWLDKQTDKRVNYQTDSLAYRLTIQERVQLVPRKITSYYLPACNVNKAFSVSIYTAGSLLTVFFFAGLCQSLGY